MPNLAGRLVVVFRALQGPTQPDRRRLIDAWRGAFNLPNASQANLLNSIALIARALERLAQQVAESKRLSAESRQTSKNLVGGLAVCVDFNHLHEVASGHSQHYDDNQLRYLVFLSDLFESEFPEPTIPENELDTLRSEIEELLAHIEQSEIDDSLKRFMIGLLSTLLWCVQNAQMLGVEGLYWAAGDLIGRLRPEVAARPSQDAAWAVTTKISAVVKRALGVADAAVRLRHGVEAVESMSEKVLGLMPGA